MRKRAEMGSSPEITGNHAGGNVVRFCRFVPFRCCGHRGMSVSLRCRASGRRCTRCVDAVVGVGAHGASRTPASECKVLVVSIVHALERNMSDDVLFCSG